MLSTIIDKICGLIYIIFADRDTLYTHITEFTFKCHVLTPAVGLLNDSFMFDLIDGRLVHYLVQE